MPLEAIEFIVGELSAELDAHIRKEELVLFLAIRALESGGARRSRYRLRWRSMEREHDRAGRFLAELPAATKSYKATPWACQTFRALYDGLEEGERDMHVHVHFENNVLFPAALARAGGVA